MKIPQMAWKAHKPYIVTIMCLFPVVSSVKTILSALYWAVKAGCLYPYNGFLVISQSIIISESWTFLCEGASGYLYEWNTYYMRVFSAPLCSHHPVLGKNKFSIKKHRVLTLWIKSPEELCFVISVQEFFVVWGDFVVKR